MELQLDKYDLIAIYIALGIGVVFLILAVLITRQNSFKAKVQTSSQLKDQEYDYIVIGAGLGGLSCASMLSKYGFKVGVFEAHYTPGGAAHAYKYKGYHFDSGPSLFGGLDTKGFDANPMGMVLQAIEEPLEIHHYNQWNVLIPEGDFKFKIGAGRGDFENNLQNISGKAAVDEWKQLMEQTLPLQKAVTAVPMAAIRLDPFVAITVLARYTKRLLMGGLAQLNLTKPFSTILDGIVKDKFLNNYVNMLCFLLSGLKADGTITAEIAFMFKEWYKDDASLDFPFGGSQAIVDALVRGLKKFGGELHLRAPVNKILVSNNQAQGIEFQQGKSTQQVFARKGVISAMSVLNTVKVCSDLPESWKSEVNNYPMCRSFMHIHLGFDATGLDNLDLHHIVVDRWDDGVDSEQNVVLVSIPTVVDPSLAPEGKHSLHAYLPATEPYEIWKDLKQGTPEYEKQKEERSQILWKALERIIPDIRQRAEVVLIGTPLTHKQWLNRDRGTYGPAFAAGKQSFPLPFTPIKQLYQAGDSSFPGIGVPAVAANGTILANTLAPFNKHLEMLKQLGL